MLMAVFNACDNEEVVRPAFYEDPKQIPCDECVPFAGYYELCDMSVSVINGSLVWRPLPVSIINGKIYSGYLKLNTMSELTVFRSGEFLNQQTNTIDPFSYTEYYNYRILSDSTLVIGSENEPGEFFPFLTPMVDRIDTIIWDRGRYVRQ